MLREDRLLSQVQLASSLHVSKQSVSNWENENILPSIDILIKLASFFSVSTDYLLGLDKKRSIDVSDLSSEEITHIQTLINDLRKRRSVEKNRLRL